MPLTPAASTSAGQPATGILGQLATDLAAETSELTAVLSGLAPPDWDSGTPAVGWTVRDQVTHLAFFDDATLLSLTDPAAFKAQRTELLALGDGFPDEIAARHSRRSGADCLAWFLRSREALLAAYRAADPGGRLSWYGPDMGVASSVTARLMETWAHGQDILDTLGKRRAPTARLRPIADLGVRTFAFSFRLRGLPVPEDKVRVGLAGPGDPVSTGSAGRPGEAASPGAQGRSGDLASPAAQRWTWGPEDAANRVEGDAEEFCLVVTQRRNVADTGLMVTGDVAARWIAIAQAFAGAASDPRPPGWVPARPASPSGPKGAAYPGRPQPRDGSRG
jgi:uncharacterized protein (TIGR03084 family)